MAEDLGRPLQMRELCALVAVSDRILRLRCAEFLGMSPTQYVLLRQLKEACRALRNADLSMVTVAEVARRFGFAELGHFAERYRATFGEAPIGHSPAYSRNATPSS